MKKELTPKSSTGSFILLFVTLIVCIILMVLFLHFVDEDAKSKPISTKKTTTKTTTTEKVDPIFNTTLENIVSKYDFNKDFDYDIYYIGAYFQMKCNNFDDDTNKCKSTNLTLKIDGTTFGLFINDENMLDNLKDYYFIVNRDYIVVLNNIVGKKTGKIRIYNLDGNLVKELDNAVSGFTINNNVVDKFYPTYENNELRYYSCDNGTVRMKITNVSDNFEQKSYENIKDSKCLN